MKWFKQLLPKADRAKGRPIPVYVGDMADMNEMDEQKLTGLFAECADVQTHTLHFGEPPAQKRVLMLYCESLCDDTPQMLNYIVPLQLEQLYRVTGFADAELVHSANKMQIQQFPDDQGVEQLVADVFAGKLLLYFPDLRALFTLDMARRPNRQPEEANTEISVRGPRDGFIEDISVNVALIRKRLRTNSLVYEPYVLGKRSQTKVGLLYIRDVIQMRVVDEARNRLSRIDIDGVFSSAQLEEMIADNSYTLFPLLDYTGRPDFAVDCLLNGRFVLIVDGNPTVLIAPVNIVQNIISPEDAYFTFVTAALGRLVRLLGLSVSLFLPGFYVALTVYHQDQLPFPFLATIVNSRLGIPISAPIEMFLTMCLLELFREAGVRLPKAVGQTLTVVGGLIIGDAAIRAGLLSPSMVVMLALTIVAGSTLVNQSLSGTVSVLRIAIFFCSALLGLYGFLFAVFALVLYMASLRSFGIPYLAPISPISLSDVLHAIFRLPLNMKKERPETLETNDSTKQ